MPLAGIFIIILFNWNTYTGFTPVFSFRMFESVVMFVGRPRNNLNLAFKAGSSKHGKARRASVGWN